MKKMLDWLTHLLWISEGIFLAASTPHIATYFAHFDNPTDFWGTIYAWGVGYGLALTIDGVSFVVLMSLIVAIKYKRSGLLVTFLVCALLLISGLSWFINWQYNIVFASSMFAKADGIITLSYLRDARELLLIESEERALEALSRHLKINAKTTLPLLIQARSIIDKEDHEERMRRDKADREERLRQEKVEEERRLEQSRREEEERLNREKAEHEAGMERLRLEQEATIEQARLEHERTMARLQVDREERERLAKESEDARVRRDKADREERLRLAREAEELRLKRERAVQEERRLEQTKSEIEEVNPQSKETQVDLLEGLQGNDTVPLETVAEILGYDARYVTRLRNEGKLKHTSKRPDRITVASLRVYQANHKRRASSASRPERDADPLTVTNGHKRVTQPLDNLVRMEV